MYELKLTIGAQVNSSDGDTFYFYPDEALEEAVHSDYYDDLGDYVLELPVTDELREFKLGDTVVLTLAKQPEYKYAYERAFAEGGVYRIGYQDLATRNGETILLETDIGDYQGDTLLLLRGTDGRIGFLVFGWGSCSGCDALQACEDLEDLHELAADLERGVRWFDDHREALAYFVNKDFTTEFFFWESEQDKVEDFRRAACNWIIELMVKELEVV